MLRRKSRELRRRQAHRRLRSEQLEDRRLLATLVFDTELVSLDLSGGPYPMPLASDPGNLLGDSVEGYGFVDSQVSITLSSERPASAPIPGPGPPSLGIACATNDPGGLNGDGQRGCLFGAPPPQDNPIDPAALDGQTFRVDSFFDVFFDITVTDVDPRPGRNFAGQDLSDPTATGTTFLLPNNGPANMIAEGYLRTFDADAPNFGLIPPPQVAPYIGHFLIEIPLGGDINGNAADCVADGLPASDCNDKIKFTIASHAAGDGNRTFTTLPDGTEIDEFDSAAFLEGAIVDERTDPPFTLGAGSPAFPAFSGPGALTGPTTATSTLLNPVASAAFPFVDADNDGLFTAGTDVALVAGELEDGVFDTAVAEGGYSPAIPGAGLYIGGSAISALSLNYGADGDLKINTDLTARQRGATLALTSRVGGVLFDDPTITTSGNLTITAALDIISVDDVLLGIGPSSEIQLNAGRDVLLSGTRIDAKKTVDLNAGRDIFVNPSVSNPAILAATFNTLGKVDLDAGRIIDVSDAQIDARKDIEMDADVVAAFNTQMTANGHGLAKIDLHGVSVVDVTAADIIARKTIEIESSGGPGVLFGADALIDAVGGGSTSVTLTSDSDVLIPGATVAAKDRVTISAVGAVFAPGSTLVANTTAAGTVSVTSGIDLILDDAVVRAKRDVILDTDAIVFADRADIQATGSRIGRIDIDADVDVYLNDAVLRAGVDIDIDALLGAIVAPGAQLLACGSASSQVRLSAGSTILLEDAVVRAAKLIELLATDVVDLDSASLGITRAGIGDILVEGTTIDVTDAVLKAPDLLTLTGTIIGTPLDDTPGTLACP